MMPPFQQMPINPQDSLTSYVFTFSELTRPHNIAHTPSQVKSLAAESSESSDIELKPGIAAEAIFHHKLGRAQVLTPICRESFPYRV
jgi:hypothetical protein